MAKDPYTDDEYDDTYKQVHGDDPARDQYAGDDSAADTFFPSGAGGRLSGWGIWSSKSAEDADGTESGEGLSRKGDEGVSTDDGDSWWDEGLITLLLVGGLALFLFPEPATSAVGIVLMGVGLVAWLVDWLA